MAVATVGVEMLKLLVIAPTCDSDDIGEAWVGYQWVTHLAARHDVTLLTYHKRGVAPASQQMSGLQEKPGLRVIEWAEPPLLGRAERFNSLLKPGYFPFYVRARRWIRRALAAGERFDLAFQPVPVAMRYPCPAAGLGLPLVVGPVGGSLESPPGFTAEEGTTPWFVQLRRLDALRLRRDPLLRRTYTEATCVLGIAGYVREFLADTPPRRLELMSETGLESLPDPVDRCGRDGPVRLLFVGRLIRTKGARDAIRAMSLLADLPVTLDIVGDGPDRAACEAQSDELGLAERVHFHGRLPRRQVEDFYRAADVFVFPSYREPGGNVTFEAMGFGLPLVVCDRGGPGNVVDSSCGFALPAENPAQLRHDVAGAVRRLVTDPELRIALGRGARLRVAELALWDRKVEQLGHLFTELIAPGTRRG